MSSRLDKNFGKFWQIHPSYEYLRLLCDQTTNQGTATSNFIYQRHSTGYISNKSEESKMFETITLGLIHKIYIIYVASNIKKNKHNDRNILGKL